MLPASTASSASCARPIRGRVPPAVAAAADRPPWQQGLRPKTMQARLTSRAQEDHKLRPITTGALSNGPSMRARAWSSYKGVEAAHLGVRPRDVGDPLRRHSVDMPMWLTSGPTRTKCPSSIGARSGPLSPRSCARPGSARGRRCAGASARPCIGPAARPRPGSGAWPRGCRSRGR